MIEGRAAAVFGPEWTPGDRSQARWGHLDAARKALAGLPARDQELYHAFIGGIRKYMDDHPEGLPSYVPVLEPALPIATYRAYLWTYMILDALEAANRGKVLDLTVLQDDAAIGNVGGSASNEVVVMPAKTIEGVTVVLSDPHGGIAELPMWEYRLRAGSFNFIGVAVVGAMLPILGHTDAVAWGATTGGPRMSDCYLLETRHDGVEYRHGEEWRQVDRHCVTLEVKNAEPVTVEFRQVKLNGMTCPVIGHDGERIAVACTPFMAPDMPPMDTTLLGWLAARNIDEWAEAASLMCMFQQNFMAGDKYGNAMYVRLGRIPRRAEGVDPTLPINGYDERTRWQGFHSFEELVQIRNPGSGYMHNDNEAPDRMFAGAHGSELAAGRYPSYIFNDVPGRTHDRGFAVEQVLGDGGKVSIDNLMRMALSDRWPTALRWRDALAVAAERGTEAWAEGEQAVLHELINFEGDCGPESTGSLAFYYLRTSIHMVFDPDADASGLSAAPLPPGAVRPEPCPDSRALWLAIEAGDALSVEQQEGLLEAVRVATRRMKTEVGRIGATFGEVFRIGRGERDWPARSAMFSAYRPATVGLGDNVMPLRFMFGADRRPDGTINLTAGGRSWRLTVFTDPIRSYSVVLYGQSSRPESPHYSDQVALYSEGRVRETGFATLLDERENA